MDCNHQGRRFCLFPGINSPFIHHRMGPKIDTQSQGEPRSSRHILGTVVGVATLAVTRRFNPFLAGGKFERSMVQSPQLHFNLVVNF